MSSAQASRVVGAYVHVITDDTGRGISSGDVTADEALTSLIVVLESIERLLPGDKAGWDGDLAVRLAVERLWITAGNTSEEYRRAAGVEAGVEPWAELAAYRNRLAHALPGDLSSDRIWTTRSRVQLASSRRCVSISAEPRRR